MSSMISGCRVRPLAFLVLVLMGAGVTARELHQTKTHQIYIAHVNDGEHLAMLLHVARARHRLSSVGFSGRVHW